MMKRSRSRREKEWGKKGWTWFKKYGRWRRRRSKVSEISRKSMPRWVLVGTATKMMREKKLNYENLCMHAVWL